MKSASDKLHIFDFLQKQDGIFHYVEGNKQTFQLNYVLFLSYKQNKYQQLVTTHSFCFLGIKSLDKQKSLLKPEGMNTEDVYYTHVSIEGFLKDQNNEKYSRGTSKLSRLCIFALIRKKGGKMFLDQQEMAQSPQSQRQHHPNVYNLQELLEHLNHKSLK